jgi:hypothetical protein
MQGDGFGDVGDGVFATRYRALKHAVRALANGSSRYGPGLVCADLSL